LHYGVFLSEAKDLIAACNRHEILRFAQEDRKREAAGWFCSQITLF